MVKGFPRGPYVLSQKFVIYRLLGVVACLLFAAAGVLVIGDLARGLAQKIQHDERVWSARGPELPADVDGRVTRGKFFVSTYSLTVHYLAPDGATREKRISFDTLGNIPEGGATTVRLAPGSQDDFALSSAVAASGQRWAAAALIAGLGILLFGGLGGYVAFTTSRQWRRAHLAARHGVPVLCQVLAREQVPSQGEEKFTFRVPATPSHSAQSVSYQLRTKGSDIITLDRGASVLAIVPAQAPQGAILLLRDFYPIRLNKAERRQARRALTDL